MAYNDTLEELEAQTPFSVRNFRNKLIAAIKNMSGAATFTAVSERGLTLSPLYCTTLTLDGRVASLIDGGRVTGAAVFGVAGANGGAEGGIIQNVVFAGAVSVVRGSWTFINCTFLSTLGVASNTTLIGGKCIGVATRTAGTAVGQLTDFVAYPTGTWTLTFADTTP